MRPFVVALERDRRQREARQQLRQRHRAFELERHRLRDGAAERERAEEVAVLAAWRRRVGVRRLAAVVVVRRAGVERPDRPPSANRPPLRVRRSDIPAELEALVAELDGLGPLECRESQPLMGTPLNPLKRYLASNVGRPWDKVYSELAQHLDKRKTTGIHIFDHVKWEVEQNCFLGSDGKVYRLRYRRAELVAGLYVHPRTGLLCWSDRKSIWHQTLAAKRAERSRNSDWRVPIRGDRHYVRLNGIWYIADLERYNCSQSPIEEEAKMCLVTENGMAWRVTNKQQCSRKELKAAGLCNDQQA